MNPDTLLGTILIGDFGLLTMTPTYMLIFLFPLITAFHFFTSALEESGLLYRLAGVCDKPLSRFGLSGLTLIPMMMGFGCVTVALASLADLKSKREKLIASVLLCIIVPCSAQVAVIIALSFLLSPAYFLFYIAAIVLTFLLLSFSLNAILPHESRHIRPLPRKSIAIPAFKPILNRSVKSGIAFIRETALPFMIGSTIVSLLSYFNWFAKLAAWFSPFTEGVLSLPRESAGLFILSIIKRDLGAAGLLSVIRSGSFTEAELTVCLIILTLFVPCFASVVILFKQEKLHTAIFIWLGSFAIAMFIGKLSGMLLL